MECGYSLEWPKYSGPGGWLQSVYGVGMGGNLTRTVFSEENVCPSTSFNRHIVKTDCTSFNRQIVKIDCIYNKLKVTIYLYVSLVKIHPFLNEIGC